MPVSRMCFYEMHLSFLKLILASAKSYGTLLCRALVSQQGCIRFGVVKVVQLVTPVTRVSEGGVARGAASLSMGRGA